MELDDFCLDFWVFIYIYVVSEREGLTTLVLVFL